MKYCIRRVALGNFPSRELDQADFEALREARSVLSCAFELEEVWELLVLNYENFEERNLRASVESSVRGLGSYSDFFRIRCSLSVALVNIFTSARMFLDQARQLVPKSSLQSFNEKASELYDGSLEYRLMEAMRNYVQHCGLPVHMVTHGIQRREQIDGTTKTEYTTAPKASRDRLFADNGFKTKFLDGLPENIDLMHYARAYVERLSTLQEFARERLQPDVAAARSLIEAQLDSYVCEHGGGPVAVAAVAEDDDGAHVERLPLLLDWDDVRRAQVKRNTQLKNLAKRVVSN